MSNREENKINLFIFYPEACGASVQEFINGFSDFHLPVSANAS